MLMLVENLFVYEEGWARRLSQTLMAKPGQNLVPTFVVSDVSDVFFSWMGALANTRGLGDLRFKKFGVTAEPEVRTKLLAGKEWAYVVLVSDGVSSTLSDDEIVDLARDAPDPKAAAEKILSFVAELGGEDNLTAIVLPLSGWGKIRGPDKTKELREYRRKQAGECKIICLMPEAQHFL